MTDIILALQITGLGMGLVFAAIILLWAMMILLTNITAAPTPPHADINSPQTDSPALTESQLQAAALAVAIALAEQQRSSTQTFPEPPTALVSAWQLGMRTRQMSEKGKNRK